MPVASGPARKGTSRTEPPAPPASPGLVVDGRYRLDELRTEHEPRPGVQVARWRAADTSLDRAVALLLVTGLSAADRKRLAAAAARASRVTDGRLVRIFDTGVVDLDPGPAVWVATEWVEAPSLATTVRHAPLAAPVAAEVVRQCAEALAAAAAAGCPHGALNPGRVLLPPGGLPRISGLGIGPLLDGDGEGAADERARDDARCLGALLVAARTGRWPLPGWTGLPVGEPRQVRRARRPGRAGVERTLDTVAETALAGGYADAAAVSRALRVLPATPLDRPADPVPPAGADWTRWLWRLVPPALVVAIGAAGWVIGSDLGRVPTPARQSHAALPPARADAPGVGHATLVWHHPPDITSFDPDGDGSEDEDAVGLAVDRDSTTAWETATYRGDPRFGGLKPGVGLLLDLHRPRTVRVGELALTAAGADLQLRAGNSRPAEAADLPVVAERSGAADHVELDLDHPTRARYWLLWITALPRTATGTYQLGVVDLALLG